MTNEKMTGAVDPDFKSTGLFYFMLLFKHKVFIVCFTIFAAIASIVVSLLLPNWYTSTVSAVPPKNAGNSLGGMIGSATSMLKDIGIKKLGGSSDEYSLIVLLQSRRIADSLIYKYNLAEVYEIPDTSMTLIRTELRSNLDISFEVDGNYLISVTDKDRNRAAAMANDFVRMANKLGVEIFLKEAIVNKKNIEQSLRSNDSTLKSIGDKLSVYSKETMMFSPEAQAKVISSSLAEIKAQVYQYEIQYEFSRDNFGENNSQTILNKDLLEKTKIKLEEIKNKPGFAGNFTLADAGRVGVEYTKLYTQFLTASKMQSFYLTSYEQAKLELSKLQSSLYIIDDAIVADKKSKPVRSLIVSGSTFGGFVISILFVLLLNAFRELKSKYAELEKLI